MKKKSHARYYQNLLHRYLVFKPKLTVLSTRDSDFLYRASVLYVGMRIMPVLLWVAVAWAASRYHAIIVIPPTHISGVVWYQLPILDGRAIDEDRWREGEQG